MGVRIHNPAFINQRTGFSIPELISKSSILPISLPMNKNKPKNGMHEVIRNLCF